MAPCFFICEAVKQLPPTAAAVATALDIFTTSEESRDGDNKTPGALYRRHHRHADERRRPGARLRLRGAAAGPASAGTAAATARLDLPRTAAADRQRQHEPGQLAGDGRGDIGK